MLFFRTVLWYNGVTESYWENQIHINTKANNNSLQGILLRHIYVSKFYTVTLLTEVEFWQDMSSDGGEFILDGWCSR